ncbi:MAG: hypothetical protein AAGD43_24720 [Pseudomonadota bacterium]
MLRKHRLNSAAEHSGRGAGQDAGAFGAWGEERAADGGDAEKADTVWIGLFELNMSVSTSSGHVLCTAQAH